MSHDEEVEMWNGGMEMSVPQLIRETFKGTNHGGGKGGISIMSTLESRFGEKRISFFCIVIAVGGTGK